MKKEIVFTEQEIKGFEKTLIELARTSDLAANNLNAVSMLLDKIHEKLLEQ